MENFELVATTRKENGKKLKSLRQQGQLPGVLYGHKVKNQSVQINYLDFDKIYKSTGGSTLVDLKIDDKKPVKVLIHDVQIDPLNSNYLHADFYQVKMDEKITAEIELKFVGEALAEKELGGILVKNFDKIKVECFPQHLVHEVTVDISSLKTFEDSITIGNLPIPAEITVQEQAKEIVVHVLPPKSEEEIEKELEEEGEEKEVEKVEVETKGKQEEGAEGEADKGEASVKGGSISGGKPEKGGEQDKSKDKVKEKEKNG